MDTLVYFLSECENFKDFIIGNKCLRIIPATKPKGFIARFLYKRKVHSLTKGHQHLIPGGEKLLFYHLLSIVKKLAGENAIFIYTMSFSHIDLLYDVIMNCKNIFFVTDELFYPELEEYLLTNFGISGAVFTKPPKKCSLSVILPEGESLSVNQCGKILNLSGKKLPYNCITPESVRFNPPKCLQNISPSVRSAHILEPVMLFMGIPFAETNLSSVKINKVIKNKNE